MNTLSFFLAAAFIVLAFLATKVLEQRNRAREQLQAALRSEGEAKEQAAAAQQELIASQRDLGAVGMARDAEVEHLREAETTIEQLRRQLAAAAELRALAWPKPERRMKESDVLAEFNVPLDAPWFVALNQELDDAISDVLDKVTLAPSVSLTAEQRTHLAGGAEELREFQKRLLELQKRASVSDEDLDDQDERKAS